MVTFFANLETLNPQTTFGLIATTTTAAAAVKIAFTRISMARSSNYNITTD